MPEKMKFTVGGNEFTLSRADVEERLMGVEPEQIRELYVQVQGVMYPIKQAFAHVTGMQRGGFTSHDAMRVFRRLSIRIGPDMAIFGEKLFTVVKSLNEFDKKEIHGVVCGLLLTTDRDKCLTGIYRRFKGNVESLLSLPYVKHFQAIAMITRSLFELAIDMKLIDVIQDAPLKMAIFSELEKLRAAEMIVAFRNVDAFESVQAEFINNNEARIKADAARVFGVNGNTTHWSGLKLRERARRLGHPFQEIYEVKYPQLSWYTHAAGLAGFDLKASSYEKLATTHHYLAVELYKLVLRSIIDEYQFSKWDSRIMAKMKLAELMPMADTDEQLLELERELLA